MIFVDIFQLFDWGV